MLAMWFGLSVRKLQEVRTILQSKEYAESIPRELHSCNKFENGNWAGTFHCV